MEATFQSYLAEAVYAMEREKSGLGLPQDDGKLSTRFISYIDADSNDDENKTDEDAPPPPIPVKMRDRRGQRPRGGPRPSGFNILDPSTSNSPILFRRNLKFFMSVNKKQQRRSPPTFYLQRSQSTKEVRSFERKGEKLSAAGQDDGKQPSIFRTFGLKRTPTWSSVVAHLNRSFKSTSPASSSDSSASETRLSSVWRRSQSCRNIERIFSSGSSRRPSQGSQTRMSTSDLRAGGLISGPTGFVHVSGYGRNSSISGSNNFNISTTKIETTSILREQTNNRTRVRELSNIDPKFTSQSGLCSSSELETSRGSIRIQHLTASSNSTSNCTTVGLHGNNPDNAKSRFPRLEECAHFHYEFTDIGPITAELLSENDEMKSLSSTKGESNQVIQVFSVQVTSNGKCWVVRRSFENFEFLDRQVHQCIFDRRFSQLPVIPQEENVTPNNGRTHKDSVRQLLSSYLHRFSTLAGPVITCGPVLNWLELDNRGHRLIVTEDCAINTPAVAAAYAIKRYAKQANDEISFEVGDMISVIDMPPPDESIWWRGKRGFEVGFFPCEYVEVIGDKVPQGLNLPMARLRRNSMGSDEADNDDPSPTNSSSDQQPTKPVLRKHGKLISFFRSFILSRPARGKLKKSGILKERVFGCDLSEHLLNTGQDVPKVLTHCAEFIEARGIIDGIYRLSGIASNIQKLRVAFDEDRVPNLYDDRAVLQDIHSVSSLLKMYFRELPNPVCTYHLYDKFVEAAKAPENERLVLMRDVVQQLPPPNYRTLEYLARHLYRVSLRGNDTGMTAKNVAIVWAPNLLRAKSLESGGVEALQGVGVQAVVTEYLIRYCELIFSDKMPSYNSSSNPQPQIDDPRNKMRPKSLAISTPTKLLSLEEARTRAQNLSHEQQAGQKFIEVGGGPKSLPQKYHTVIDLPSRRSQRQRKSPIGWKAIFKSKANKSKPNVDLNCQDQAVTDNELRSAMPRALLRPVKSAESLAMASNVQRSKSERRSSRNALLIQDVPDHMESSDDLAPLETVSRAVANSHVMRDSPKTHSRSNSHDSYFEKRLSSSHDNHKMDSNLDLSEIQVNFDLEENEMKIFSEDEAMMTNSLDDGCSDDFSKSPLEEQLPVLPMKTSSPKSSLSKSEAANTDNSPPKGRKMSFREKFKRFTSPTPNRKLLGGTDMSCDESSSDGRGDTPPREPKTEKTLREKIVCALSPESLRKRENHESSPKKKKSSFSPGTSPSNTSQLVKRSKIEDNCCDEEEEEDVPLETKEILARKVTEIPLSPSINFIDASMTESYESATKINGPGAIVAGATKTAETANPRFSTTSSNEGEDQQKLDQLVVAQVHRDPISENRAAEEKENNRLLIDEPKKLLDYYNDEDDDEAREEDKTSSSNIESYSIAGATVSENESFSLASVEDEEDIKLTDTTTTTQPSSNPEATLEAQKLPANHVIQYSPRLASATKNSKKSQWQPIPQSYHEDDDDEQPMDVDEQQKSPKISCPLFPRGEASMVTMAQVQLDHDQNLNTAGVGAEEPDDDIKGDINNPHPQEDSKTPTSILTPSPRPRSKIFSDSASSNASEIMDASSSSRRGPVPTPRKSVTLMEVEEATITPEPRRASSAMDRKITFGHPVTKKLSTFSLHNVLASEAGLEESSLLPELDAPLQRRNSIHNVPYVDVNDPQTRERMERYKEERRSMLRAKYKMEDYMSTSASENKYRRKSSSVNETTICQDDQPPVQLRKESAGVAATKAASPVRESGLIEDDVNVKERAAIFGGRAAGEGSKNNNRAKSWTNSLVNTKTSINGGSSSSTRPTSENNAIVEANKINNGRKVSPGSPSKIRDMAAFFEQKN